MSCAKESTLSSEILIDLIGSKFVVDRISLSVVAVTIIVDVCENKEIGDKTITKNIVLKKSLSFA